MSRDGAGTTGMGCAIACDRASGASASQGVLRTNNMVAKNRAAMILTR